MKYSFSPILFFQISMCLHLSGWNFNNHLSLHCSGIHKSCCSISWSFLFVMALNILMSSANRNVLDLVKSGRSFTYRTNNKGPRTDPCGIPDVTLCQFDSFPLVVNVVFTVFKCLFPIYI